MRSMRWMRWERTDSADERKGRQDPPGIGPVESLSLVLLFLGVILVRPFVVAWNWLIP